LNWPKKLVDAAFSARADSVKFQKRTIEDILTKEALGPALYSPTALAPTYGEHRQRLELSEKDFRELAEYSKAKGITFLASGWDAKSVTLSIPSASRLLK